LGHFFVFQQFISGCLGLIVFSLYYIYSYFNPSERLRCFLCLQGFVIVIIFLNAFHAYNLFVLGAKPGLQVASYCFSIVWAPGFLYYTSLFYLNLSKHELSSAGKRLLLLSATIVGALSFFPLILSHDLSGILTGQKWIQRHIIVPTCGFTQVGFAIYFFIDTRRRNYRNHKIMSLCLIILNTAIAALCFLAIDLLPLPELLAMEPYLIVLDYYFLFWNLMAIAVFFMVVPLIRKKRKELLKARPSACEPTTDAAMEREWRLVEAALVGKGLFRKTGLDLSMLSRETGMPRNRLSLIVNSRTGKTFNDYVNSIRVDEFKKIASSQAFSGNILDAAFEAGFNSKATFYNWVKKNLNVCPSEYIKGLRSDQFESGKLGPR